MRSFLVVLVVFCVIGCGTDAGRAPTAIEPAPRDSTVALIVQCQDKSHSSCHKNEHYVYADGVLLFTIYRDYQRESTQVALGSVISWRYESSCTQNEYTRDTIAEVDLLINVDK